MYIGELNISFFTLAEADSVAKNNIKCKKKENKNAGISSCFSHVLPVLVYPSHSNSYCSVKCRISEYDNVLM